MGCARPRPPFGRCPALTAMVMKSPAGRAATDRHRQPSVTEGVSPRFKRAQPNLGRKPDPTNAIGLILI